MPAPAWTRLCGGPARSSPRSPRPARSGRPSRSTRTTWSATPTATPVTTRARAGCCPTAAPRRTNGLRGSPSGPSGTALSGACQVGQLSPECRCGSGASPGSHDGRGELNAVLAGDRGPAPLLEGVDVDLVGPYRTHPLQERQEAADRIGHIGEGQPAGAAAHWGGAAQRGGG